MEEMVDFWRGKSVFLTGHTGFKGGWLALWLKHMGANVHGYALDPNTHPSFFEVVGIKDIMASDTRADLRDSERLASTLEGLDVDFVFHLAAQPLVRESYANPVDTFATNVLGTVNLLDAVRHSDEVPGVLVITTDKVYQNKEWEHPYRESDPLGGNDPYSASKAATEMVAGSYRHSFYGNAGNRLATARAGNVIGGGDWATDRLVPDCLKAFEKGEVVHLRNPDSIRPWQHVLDPLYGYLTLAKTMMEHEEGEFYPCWNFGPSAEDDATVAEVAGAIAEAWGPEANVSLGTDKDQPHEAGLLRLDSSLAQKELAWHPQWNYQQSIVKTVEWHREWLEGGDMKEFSLKQIDQFTNNPS